MIRREPTKSGDKARVTFELPNNDDDGEVFVVGDFNAWSVGETPLRRRGDIRTASLILVTGRRYAFRYWHNGKWFNDEQADGYEPNEFGETNGILDLSEV